MKMNKASIWIVALLFVILLTGGCTFIAYEVWQGQSESKEQEEIETFAKYANEEIFQSIPLMEAKDTQIGEAYQFGENSYTIHVSGTTKEDYDSYISLIQQNGF